MPPSSPGIRELPGRRRGSNLKRERLSDQLAAELLSAIVGGEYPPDVPFASEGELVEQFAVSRVVAREALRMLGSTHVVDAQQGKRATVRPVQEWDLFSPTVARAFREVQPPSEIRVQLYDTRAIVESGAAELCAVAHTDAELQRIQSYALELSQRATSRGEPGPFLELDRAFHEAVAAGCRNGALQALLRTLGTLTLSQWTPGGIRLRRLTLSNVAEQHQAIADAIARRDAPGARQAMHDHIEWAKKNDTGA